MNIAKNKVLCIILCLAITFSFALQTYSNSRSAYNYQYNYRSNSGYYGYGSQQNTYRAGWLNNGGPFSAGQRTCNALFGCTNVQTSHMYIQSQLDQVYYNNPRLLAPRYGVRYAWR